MSTMKRRVAPPKPAADTATRDLNVEVPVQLHKRLRDYVHAHEGETKKGVVAAAIDEYLKKRGA